MSADNYLLVGKWRGRYFVENRSASVEYDRRYKPGRGADWFDTFQAALTHADKEVKEGYYEYGLELEQGVML